MLEVVGNLWTHPADVRVITTNGSVRKDGSCVMGRGCALEAKQKFPPLAKMLGAHLRANGNIPFHYHDEATQTRLFTLPVKFYWHEKANIALILHSVQSLLDRLMMYPDWTIVIPRPGCGNGGLHWDEVKPVLAPILSDRFHVITFK